MKIIDDALYDTDIEQSFFHIWDYQTMCVKNGIAINKSKFQFCQDNIEFRGLLVTPCGISPSPKILAAIKDFTVLKDISGA